MIFQNQNRYIFVLAPIVSVAAALTIDHVRNTQRQQTALAALLAAAVVCVSFLGGSALLANHYRTSSTLEAEMIAAVKSTLSDTRGPMLSTGSSAAVISVAYAAAPRPVVVVDPSINTIEQVASLVRSRQPEVVLGRATDAPFLTRGIQRALPGGTLEPMGVVTTPGGELEVWKIKLPGQ